MKSTISQRRSVTRRWTRTEDGTNEFLYRSVLAAGWRTCPERPEIEKLSQIGWVLSFKIYMNFLCTAFSYKLSKYSSSHLVILEAFLIILLILFLSSIHIAHPQHEIPKQIMLSIMDVTHFFTDNYFPQNILFSLYF